MSLAISLSTAHGIIMAADRCITITANGNSFSKTMYERKLFLCENGYGFSYAGSADFKGFPASYWMERFTKRFSPLGLSVSDFVRKLCTAFRFLDSSKNIIIIGSGYQNGTPCVYSSSSTAKEITEHPFGMAVYAGETDIAKGIIDRFPCNRGDFTIPDAVEFVCHVISATSNIQRFGKVPVTVSPDCDVLLIKQNGSQWILSPYMSQ